MEEPEVSSRRPRHAVRRLVWIVLGVLIIGAGLLGGPKLWAVDTDCFPTSSIPPGKLILVKGQDNIYTLAPCGAPGAKVTVQIAQRPAGRVLFNPTTVDFTDATRKNVIVNVPIAMTKPYTTLIYHSASSTDPTYNLQPAHMPALIAEYNPPFARNNIAIVKKGQSAKIAVLTNDIDRSGTGLHIKSLSGAFHGATAIGPNNTALYTPTGNYVGVDLFSYVVADGNGNTDSALVGVLVAPGNAGQPERKPIKPDEPTTLVFTTNVKTPAGKLPLTTTIEIPAGAFTMTLEQKDAFVLVYTPIITPTGNTNNPPNAYNYANLSFRIDALLNGALLTGYKFAKPVTVTVQYDPRLLGGLDEKTLAPFIWSEATKTWVQTGISHIVANPVTHTISFVIDNVIGEVSFFAKPVVFIPYAAGGK